MSPSMRLLYLFFFSVFIAMLWFVGSQFTAPDERLNAADIEIKSVVTEVKRQLQEIDAERQNLGELALFELKEFELEIAFVAKKSIESSSEGTIKLISINSGVSKNRESTQRLKLKWSALQGELKVVPGEELKLEDF